jgi:two-component system, OmpR family, response regulator
MRVLVVDDEVKLASVLQRRMRGYGIGVDVVWSGEAALDRAGATEYDAIILDLMLPGLDGFETCERLRAAGIWAPTLMLTARSEVADRIRGLDSGADDYLTKPFSLEELLARLRALTRRGLPPRPTVLEVGDLRLDPADRRAWRGDVELSLTMREYALLETFMRRPGQVLGRFELLEHAWDESYEHRSNVIEVYIGYLRDKVDRPFSRRSLQTVRGAGYRLQVED